MASDITIMKRALAKEAEAVCAKLLPDGKRVGTEWVYDPGTGKLKVELRGSKAGIWSWFGGDDDGGDLVDLWRWVSKLPMVQVLDEIRSYLGIERPEHLNKRDREWNRPIPVRADPPKDSQVYDYLVNKRKIPMESLNVYHIGELPDRKTIAFSFIVEPGDVRLIKTREAVDGAKPKPTEKDCEPILFGWHLVKPTDRDMIITEGELDAPSLHAFDVGYPVLSVPFGGGAGNKQQWIENDFERLEAFETFFLALDNDPEGDKACEEIAKRVGRHRCRRVRLPRKDANQCLMDGVPRDEVVDCITNAVTLDPSGLRKVTEFTDDVVKLFFPQPGDHVGYALPWSKVGGRVLFRPAEVTVWSGMTGCGKSQVISSCVPFWVQQGSVVTIASLEMHPKQTLRRMVKQTGGLGEPTEKFVRRIMSWLDGDNRHGGRVLMYDLLGKTQIDELLEVFTFARMKYGADQFVIDSLMRLGLAVDDYTGQENLMFRLVDWAIEHEVHVHLVAHNRKQGDIKGSQGIEGVKGSSEVGANAFNQLEIVRNRSVEEIVEKHARGEELTEKEEKLLGMPGVVAYVNKQRNGDWEGKIGLWFDQPTYQYRGEKPTPLNAVQYCSCSEGL